MMFKAVLSSVRPLAMFAFLALAVAPPAAFAGTAALSWNAPATNTDGSTLSDLSGYRIHYGTAPGSYSQTIEAGKNTTYTVPSLVDGSTYYFAVTAYNSAGNESSKSAEVSKTLQVSDVTGPVISGVYADSVTASAARVNWSTNEPADSLVEYGTTASYGYKNPLDGMLATAHSQTIAGLAPSTLYNYKVTSRDASGNVTSSGNLTFTTAAPADTVPPVISGITVTNITSTSATVTWKTDEPSTSRVDYGSGYAASTAQDTAMTTIHSAEITTLSGFTTYDFRVVSTDAAGNTGVSENQTFTTSNTLPSISSFTASATSGNAPLMVNFVASGADTDGFISSYKWDFDGDGVYDLDTGSTGRATHTYDSAGTYNAKVVATDNGGAFAESETLVITVNTPTNQPPVVLSITVTIINGGTGLSVKFEISAQDPNGSIVKFEWDFDGNGTIDATTTTAPASYSYTTPGTYTPTVTVTDNNGATAKGTAAITVSEQNGSGSGVTPSSTDASSGSAAGACFIASAAYGSYLEPEVVVLREFRDRVLLVNPAGSAFVSLYYSVSPPLADFISRHEGARTAVRIMLTPVVYGVKYPQATLMLMLLTAAGIILHRRRKT